MEDPIVPREAERAELTPRAASRSGRADDARRARLGLLLEAGWTWATIRDKLDCNDAFIDRWSHPTVYLHFTPITDLRRKLMNYIRHYNKAPKTVKWRYFDPRPRITPHSIVAVHERIRGFRTFNFRA